MSPAEDVAMRALKLKVGDEVSRKTWQLAVEVAEIVLEALRADAPVPAGKEPVAKVQATGSSDRKISQLKGYTGDECPDCGKFTMVRNGTCLKCDDCGSTTGCS
jgi:predicted RNA-binding Zn-ribbon protein involved in translation (DUF1610 family)